MKILSMAVLLVVLAGVAPEKIDINSAPLEELVKIIHIGEARAKELISLRPFSSLDDLAKIKGIGETRIKDIKSQGLAWVSAPIENKPNEPEPYIEKQLAQEYFSPPLIAVVLSAFSAVIILFLKKSWKQVKM